MPNYTQVNKKMSSPRTKIYLRNEDLITSETFEPRLKGFKNLSGLNSGFIEFSFLSKASIKTHSKLTFSPVKIKSE
jgi:hypothetical protein